MGATVTVACKLPNGLLLRVFKPVKKDVPVLGGGMKEVTEFDPVGDVVKINGNAVPHGEAPGHQIIGRRSLGFALTHNVDKDFFDEWIKQNAKHDAVVNKLVWAFEKPDSAEKHAKALNKDVKSGLEPVDPKNPPKGLARIRPDSEKNAEEAA